MVPDSCVAMIDTLPATGADGGLIWIIAAIGAGGLAFGLLMLRAARTRRGAPAALAVLAALGVAAAVLVPATPAAAAGSVDYGAGCTLMRIDDVAVPPASAATLVPGSEVAVLTATVRNPTPAAIRIHLSPELLSGARPGITVTGFAGAEPTTSFELAPGAARTVSVHVALATDAGNELQGLTSPTRLVLTAEQR
ncbi:hypothetical protein AB0N73_14145 [Microbacterium sp. NPDC089189]|uniref:hypothetical protein n=1 Tax=Microbacterium sp. NPDC089189 TaxID=3154972 RepID=UPI00342C35BF